MKRISSLSICLIVQLILVSSSWCQQQVVATAGNSTTKNDVEINWTVGQVAANGTTNNDIYLGSGFQQSTPLLSIVAGLPKSLQKITIYPNPTTEHVTISSASGPYKGTYQLINLLGRVVLEKTDVDFRAKQVVDMYDFSEGGYILKISVGSQPVQQFKIIKQ